MGFSLGNELISCGLGKEEAHRVVWATEVTYNLTESDKKGGEARRKHTEHSEEHHTSRERDRGKSAVTQKRCYDSTLPKCMTDFECFNHSHIPAYNSLPPMHSARGIYHQHRIDCSNSFLPADSQYLPSISVQD